MSGKAISIKCRADLGITREISTNLLPDPSDPKAGKTFRQVLMDIQLEHKPDTTLFHTIDRQFRSDIIVNFQFHPEYASEANNFIAGLIPFLRDNGHSFHLKMFSAEALQCHAKAIWNPMTREADSETDAELAKLLSEDDELNFTDKPTLDKAEVQDQNPASIKDSAVTIDIPDFPGYKPPSMRADDDSISTLHLNKTNLSPLEPSQSAMTKSCKVFTSQWAVSKILYTFFIQPHELVVLPRAAAKVACWCCCPE